MATGIKPEISEAARPGGFSLWTQVISGLSFKKGGRPWDCLTSRSKKGSVSVQKFRCEEQVHSESCLRSWTIQRTQGHFWNQHEAPASRLVKLYNQIQDYMDEIDRFAERLDRYIQELERRGGWKMDYLTVGSVMIIAIGIIMLLVWKIAQKVVEFERR